MIRSAHPLAISGFITIAIGLGVLLAAYFQARNKNFRNHRKLMIIAATTLALFLIQYVFRLGVLREETKFEGSDNVRNYGTHNNSGNYDWIHCETWSKNLEKSTVYRTKSPIFPQRIQIRTSVHW